MKKMIYTPLISAAVGMVLVGLIPLFVHDNYKLGVLMLIAIHTMLAVGLNLLMGYAGQVSLGHAAFFGLGAYVSAILTTQYHFSPWLALAVGIVFTGLVAYLIGTACLRLRGHYLAMATLGFGWIVYIVMKQWVALTQGPSGINDIPKLAFGRLVIDTDPERFYLTWAVAIIVLLISVNIINSRVGRSLRALHGSEAAAATLGINIAKAKIQVFVLSAAFAALAGSLYAHCINFISPSTFGFGLSVELVVMAVIGGMASIWGALVGAGSITLLSEWLRALTTALKESHPNWTATPDFDVIVHGAILMIVLIFLPSGLFCAARDAVARKWRHRRRIQATTPHEVRETALR